MNHQNQHSPLGGGGGEGDDNGAEMPTYILDKGLEFYELTFRH